MRVFLLDLWLDLREKRLAPVALGLLAAILIVPFVLASGDPGEPPPPPPSQAAEDADLPTVNVPGEAGEIDSRLTAFDPRDPFEPTGAASVSPGGGGEAAGDSGEAGGDSGGDTGGDTGGGTGGGTPTGPTGGGDTGGGTPTGPTGGGDTGGATERRTVVYTFNVDILYGELGEERRFRRVRRLELIPNEDDPAVVFLGVTTSGRTAVFLVDDRFTVSGEGICRPSPEECTFLYLREDGERNTAVLEETDGTRTRLTLRNIRRVALDAESGDRVDEDDNTGSGDRRPAFTGSNRDNAPPGEPEPEADDEQRRSFKSPVFADDTER